MISVAEARSRILEKLRPTPTETVALAQAWGRVLGAPVVARLTQPPFDVSAMDGYAVRAAGRRIGRPASRGGSGPGRSPIRGPGQCG